MCIVSCTINLINDRLVYPKYHIGALLGLLYVDAVHHFYGNERKKIEGGPGGGVVFPPAAWNRVNVTGKLVNIVI